MPNELSNEQLGEKIESLTTSANDLLSGLSDTPSADDLKAAQAELTSLQAEVAPLLKAREDRLTDESMKALTGQVTNLTDVVNQLQEGARHLPNFPSLAAGETGKGYQDGAHSIFKDIMLAAKGGKAGNAAAERLEEGVGEKAFTEGDDANGGYLVTPQQLGTLAPREAPENLRSIFPSVRVKSDSIEFVSQTGGLIAGWAAELAQKPEGGNISFDTLQASIFTAAGLAVASNQLLEDSSIDQFLAADLRKRVDRVIDSAILTGSGIGQPRGILNTYGRQIVEYDDASPTVAELLVKVAEGIATLQTEHLAEPSHIVLTPQTWVKIITDADAEGKFTLGARLSDGAGQRGPLDRLFLPRTLYGYPVVLSGLLPRNLNDDGTTGGNQTRILILDSSESLLLQRNDLTVDKSEHVYFTSNQTVFRGEQRVGFTAARYPKSIVEVKGTGLVNTAF